MAVKRQNDRLATSAQELLWTGSMRDAIRSENIRRKVPHGETGKLPLGEVCLYDRHGVGDSAKF